MAGSSRTAESTGPTPVPTTIPEVLRPGTAVGRYVLGPRIGRGGMGTIYQAFDPQLKRSLAIKFIRADRKGSTELLEEAQTLAQLSHPNILLVLDSGQFVDGQFLAMELMGGGNLREWLLRKPRGWSEIVRCFISVGEGLAAAHDRGIVHRDFKPENVLFDAEERPRLSDFGLARAIEVLAARSDGPNPPRPSGTRGYLSPEQLAHEVVGPASDQFSFCVALCEALYGGRPFGNDVGPELPPPSIPDTRNVPAWLRAVVLKGLARQPVERFASMNDLLAALRDDPAPKRRRRATAALGVAVVSLAASAYAYGSTREARECRQLAQATRDEIFGASRAEQIRRAFLAANPERGAADFEHVQQQFEREVASWLVSATQACSIGDNNLRKRVQLCLDEHHTPLEAISSLFAVADPRIEDNALSTVRSLEPSAGCVEGKTLAGTELATTIPPDDPLGTELERARILLVAGAYGDAIEKAISVLASADEKHDVPVSAEANLLLGEVYTQLLDTPASGYLKQAILLSERMGNDSLRARAALTYSAWYSNRNEKEGWWINAKDQLNIAEAIVERLPERHDLNARVLTQWARLHQLNGEREHAVSEFEQAHKELRSHLAPDHPAVLNAQSNLALAQDPPKSLTTLDDVLQTKQSLYGPDHPEVASAWHNVGVKRNEAGNCLGALAAFGKAIELRKKATYDLSRLGRSHAARATTLAESCMRLEDAYAEFKEATLQLELGQAPVAERIRVLKKMKQVMRELGMPLGDLCPVHDKINELGGTLEEDLDEECIDGAGAGIDAGSRVTPTRDTHRVTQ